MDQHRLIECVKNFFVLNPTEHAQQIHPQNSNSEEGRERERESVCKIPNTILKILKRWGGVEEGERK